MKVWSLSLCFALSACAPATEYPEETGLVSSADDMGSAIYDSTIREGGDGGIGLQGDAATIECGALTECNGRCVEFETDVLNCGGCGRTCALYNAEASCQEGRCAIETCADGFVDHDGDPETGCEVEDLCDEGAECMSECGIGQTQCEGPMAICIPPEETCNAVDDTCDGQCDEGQISGCRQGVHRAYGGAQGHAYGDDAGWLTGNGFRIEANNYFYLYQEPHLGMRPAQICPSGNGRYFLSSDNACDIGRAPIAVIGFWSPEPVCGAIPLYGLHKPGPGIHFYTTSAGERDNAINALGYVDEGIAGYVWPSP